MDIKFILIAPPPKRPGQPHLAAAWKQAIEHYYPNLNDSPFTVLEGRSQDIDPALLRCDCVVSPANSYGIMDGGFDLQLSRDFRINNDIWSLTSHVQSYIHERWCGFAPPGSCTLVPLPAYSATWGAFALAVLPTMRTPEDVSWHQDLVYNTMWTFLVELKQWNASSHMDAEIRTVAMTGLETGQGGISAQRAAMQMVLAVKHFHEGVKQNARWKDVQERNDEIEGTECL
ncbi:hypothetical protein H0H92_011246 [Tricholoma furcatifolium]|nr:hypothetical protein H0H92_011246 [Tricholoma furcatifolium]